MAEDQTERKLLFMERMNTLIAKSEAEFVDVSTTSKYPYCPPHRRPWTGLPTGTAKEMTEQQEGK